MKKITKMDLVRLTTLAVGKELTANQENVNIVITAFLDVIKTELNAGTTVFIRDFAGFKPGIRLAHKGYDVRLKEKVDKPDKKVIRVKMSSTLLTPSKEVESK
jgi:nucleoid DNA-binding protein